MYLNVTFEDGQSREIPVSTAHTLEVKDVTLGTVDSFAFGGVESILLVLTHEAPVENEPEAAEPYVDDDPDDWPTPADAKP